MSAASLVGTFQNFIVFGLVSAILGYAIDLLIPIMNTWNGIPMDAITTIGQLKLFYIAGPFLYAVSLVINHLINANNEFSNEV
jgi:hypothetical protein